MAEKRSAVHKSGTKSVMWNAIGVLVRQAFLVASTIILARILGPSGYALVALVLIYTSLTTLILDQGLSTGLIRVKDLARRDIGSAQTLNLLLSVGIGLLTAAAATSISAFVHSPQLAEILIVLAIALPIKGLGVVPRVLLARALDFRAQAIADVIASVCGLCAMLAVLAYDASPWAFVAQVVVADLVLTLSLVVLARPAGPNFAFSGTKEMLAFGSRVLASNSLGYIVHNAENALIARYLGDVSLAVYSVAYRFVTMPVQLVGQILSRVLFSLIARRVNSGMEYLSAIRTAVRCVALVFIPLLVIVSLNSASIVQFVLGDDWDDAALPLSILAIAGARQAITTVNTPVLMGLNQATILLRFSAVAATIQVSAIVIGLNWGIVGVAVAFTAAGFALTPAISWLQHRYANYAVGMQLRDLWPAVHGALWVGVVGAIAHVVSDGSGVLAGAGYAALELAAFVAVIGIFHRGSVREIATRLRALKSQAAPTETAREAAER